MSADFKYLHQASSLTWYLDHRICPEVRAMFAAMSSRMPAGGIRARYAEVVDSIVGDLKNHSLFSASEDWKWRSLAEDKLAEYPLHPIVQGFFDKFVAKYGHSSVLELAGHPPVFVEGISWWTAYMLFDTPLVIGQEFSTRAVRHKSWPLAQEIERAPTVERDAFAALHRDWLDLFNDEVDAWKERFKDPVEREKAGLKDKEPFRPALDRARWALPGSFSTGAAFTSHLRDRSRALDALRVQLPDPVFRDIQAGWEKALPGFQGMGLREAVVDQHQVPVNSRVPLNPAPVTVTEPLLWSGFASTYLHNHPYGRQVSLADTNWARGKKSYADALYNHMARVDVRIYCSLAVSRDWHRHRTMMPWTLDLAQDAKGEIHIHPFYEINNRDRAMELMDRSRTLYQYLLGPCRHLAHLALPMGTSCVMSGQGGLRDVLYMLELRYYAHGANPEYRLQAKSMLQSLYKRIPKEERERLFPMGLELD